MTELDTLFGIEFTILHARIHNFCTRLAFRRWESHWIHLLLESSSNTSYISYEEVYSLQMIHGWFYGITPIPPYILSSLISPFHVFLRRRPPECGICMSQISRSRFSFPLRVVALIVVAVAAIFRFCFIV